MYAEDSDPSQNEPSNVSSQATLYLHLFDEFSHIPDIKNRIAEGYANQNILYMCHSFAPIW